MYRPGPDKQGPGGMYRQARSRRTGSRQTDRHGSNRQSPEKQAFYTFSTHKQTLHLVFYYMGFLIIWYF